MNGIVKRNLFNIFATPIYETNPNFMKNIYFLFLLVITLNTNAQDSNCEEANSYLVNAYSHVKDSYDSNNISHLKYYANRSVESFKLSKETLTNCGCEKALNLANKSVDLLVKVEDAETFEDGRFFVKRARGLSKESVIEIDKCSYDNTTDDVETDTFDTADNSENTELNDLQKEQLKLKQQQEALKQKEAEIKQKLAQQQEKALTLKKEQLSLSYKKAIASNIKTYNETLKVCGCKHDVLKADAENDDISIMSIESINKSYNSKLKALASKYLEQIDLCDK